MSPTSSLHQRSLHKPYSLLFHKSSTDGHSKPYSFSMLFNRTTLLLLLTLLIILGVFSPWIGERSTFFSSLGNSRVSLEAKWRAYTLPEAVSYVAKNGSTVIVCAVSHPYLPFLNNWLISIVRQKHHDKVLVIAEDYATLYTVNGRWPGHAVLIPPAPDAQVAHKFGSQGFFNFTSRRPRHLLQILELGYSVMYNDVDMVWLADPFPYLKGKHDVYFMDDMSAVKPLDHPNVLPPPGKKGRTYICSCMIYMHPTPGAKLVMKKWIEELEAQPWSKAKKANDQPAFNWALNKTAGQVDLYLLPQAAFPTGGLYFKNQTWVEETKGKHVIIHNNYILGFEKKIKRFHDYNLWLVDDHASESPLGRLE
ncbi:UDP-D-xylose:L-fucose alpha-1,3-D-xylosyltransferase MGP4-like isoform X1 [Cynara cardunculus var. scolymus]|uniref:Glycosyltransferase n=1 Tax=Cynara cardunculus var. scolymus TaxID=59895 RepID=A0A103XE49_CYNCS|nr:UDP-D-xylose:L-fucose alpha-1,3-D-xylosyltransferase MGP4-like isoform X1 [Cynara cardunculus var. scolymus]KVH89072.1 Nucleotide-diphospho-sugar transferase [Cynara cardunculus var. scolymus]